MEKFYRVVNNTFGEPSNFIIIVMEDELDIQELWIRPVKHNNYTEYSFYKARKLCDAISGQKLEEYLFTSNNHYNNQWYKYELLPINFFPGNYYSKIFRPMLKSSSNGTNVITFSKGTQNLFNAGINYDYLPFDEKSMLSGLQQLRIFIDRLESIFNNIQPTKQNWNSYGHEIRNLLILVCTEFEAQLKGVLKANNYRNGSSQNYGTSDYVKLLYPMYLNSYRIKLSYFPEIDYLVPFNDWNSNYPTKTLVWYNAYNSVKHDREGSFHEATLINTINSIAGLAIVLIAQYGFNIPYWKDLIGNFFEFSHVPDWNFEHCYLPPLEGREWKKLNLEL